MWNFSQWEEKHQNELSKKIETIHNKTQSVRDLTTTLAILVVGDQFSSLDSTDFWQLNRLNGPHRKGTLPLLSQPSSSQGNHHQSFLSANLIEMYYVYDKTSASRGIWGGINLWVSLLIKNMKKRNSWKGLKQTHITVKRIIPWWKWWTKNYLDFDLHGSIFTKAWKAQNGRSWCPFSPFWFE